MKNYKMWIDGKWTDAESKKTFPVFNPTTGEEIAFLPQGDKHDADKAVVAAKKAFPAWSRMPQAERSQIVKKIASAIQAHAQELIELDVLDHGTTRSDAGWMVGWAVSNLEWAARASMSMTGDVLQQIDPKRKILLQHEPIGVSALITPWNVPLVSFAAKVGASIVVGNTCVLKPPSIDALSTMKIAEILSELDLPKGVINIVTGPGGSVGEALASHPDVGLISFTGSCEVGKRLMELSSQTMKRLQLELGGKNPVIVLDDADIDTAVFLMLMMQYGSVGQACAAPGRFYLHKKIHDQFIEKFIAGAEKLIVGDPNNEKTQVGPMASAEQRATVERYIQSGIKEGANLRLGGKRPADPSLSKGYFIMPAVVTGIKQDMTIGREEVFGPVACFMEPVNSDDEAIEKANDSTYGLVSYVWTRDTARGIRVADRMATGTVYINKCAPPCADAAWIGCKQSGLGVEGTKYGLENFTQLKHISIDLYP